MNAASRVGYLGLGSNVGDREAHLQGAISLLGGQGVEVEAVSSLYETEPVGEILDQPDFLNAAVRVATVLAPRQRLLDARLHVGGVALVAMLLHQRPAGLADRDSTGVLLGRGRGLFFRGGRDLTARRRKHAGGEDTAISLGQG